MSTEKIINLYYSRMSQTFLNGMLAEKCRLAQTLISDILATMPQHLLETHRRTITDASKAIQEIEHDVRSKDHKD